ncbi:MAG: DUF488 family protein, partial [Verrucomicrobiota bacterium]|nr:DUF488 family protein [Verrucomicrobiota bacterium]
DEGHRLLITRYRPRGVAKADEAWDEWQPKLGPSRSLHGAVYREDASPLPWAQYRKRYMAEQTANAEMIAGLARRVAAGETITLLCSSACVRESRCHRSILRELIEAAVVSIAAPGPPIP